ncbi:LysM peptidoglycan-binding domain-containing protein [bacterium]|nr:LysM peptidoglycan-binding domain-containing protein [bacterium]
MALRLLVLVLCLSNFAHARPRYRYYLDKNRAEQDLASIPVHGPLSESQWLSILGNRRNSSFVVQPGDNLWTISSRGFGDPFLWRKLWQVNPELTNPHDISVGISLNYNRSGQAGDWEVPLIHLRPSGTGAQDIERDVVINNDYRNQLRAPLLILEPEDFRGEISASTSEQEYLSYHSKTFVRGLNGQVIPPKGKYTVVREEGSLRDASRFFSSYLGKLVRVVADVDVVDEHEGIAKIVFAHQYERIQRGDKLIDFVEPVKSLPIYNPPDDMTVLVVRGESDERNAFAQGQMVLVNKGQEEGVKEGFLFRAVEDEDRFRHSGNGMLADYKAEIQIIRADKRASVGYIRKSQYPLEIGDQLLAAQLFLEPPPSPRRLKQEIHLD